MRKQPIRTEDYTSFAGREPHEHHTHPFLGHIQAPDTPQRISDAVKNTLAERDLIGTARGILMERLDLDQRAAMHHLNSLAHHAGTTIGSIAAMISQRQDLTPFSGDE